MVLELSLLVLFVCVLALCLALWLHPWRPRPRARGVTQGRVTQTCSITRAVGSFSADGVKVGSHVVVNGQRLRVTSVTETVLELEALS